MVNLRILIFNNWVIPIVITFNQAITWSSCLQHCVLHLLLRIIHSILIWARYYTCAHIRLGFFISRHFWSSIVSSWNQISYLLVWISSSATLIWKSRALFAICDVLMQLWVRSTYLSLWLHLLCFILLWLIFHLSPIYIFAVKNEWLRKVVWVFGWLCRHSWLIDKKILRFFLLWSVCSLFKSSCWSSEVISTWLRDLPHSLIYIHFLVWTKGNS